MRLRSLVGLVLLGAVAVQAPPAHAAGKRVAVIVAIADYPGLPAEHQLTSAQDDAKALARYLEDHGGYAAVHTLYGSVASASAVRSLLLDTMPASVAGGDTVLITFIGHGVGGDIEEPYLIAHDTVWDDIEGTGIDTLALGGELAQTYAGVNLIVITDAAHPGDVQGTALLGPSAKDWPQVRGSVFLLSSAAPRESATDGMFTPLLIEGLEGEADANADGQVTASELHRHLLVSVAEATGDTVHPAEAGTYEPNLVVSLATRTPAPAVVEPVPPAPEETSRRLGGPVSGVLVVVGAVAAGTAGVATWRARKICGDIMSAKGCADPEYTKMYNNWRFAQPALYIGGAVLVTAGVGVAFVPLDGGGAVTLALRF